jgi:hypothetical protein
MYRSGNASGKAVHPVMIARVVLDIAVVTES